MKHSDSPSPLWSLIALFLVASIPTAVFYKEGRSPGGTNAASPCARCDLGQDGNFLPVSNEPGGGLLYHPYYDETGKPNPRWFGNPLQRKNGLILIGNGIALDTSEIFDEALLRKGNK